MLDDESISLLALDDASIANAARNVNRTIERFIKAFGDEPAAVPTCRALEGESTGKHIAMHIAALQHLQGVRVMEHLTDFADALQRRRVLVAALCGRALLETAAAIVYIEENIASLLREQRFDSLLDELHRWYAGGRFDWFGAPDVETSKARMRSYASSKEPEVPAERRATNVLTLVARLDKRLHATLPVEGGEGGAIRIAYAMLSDICHPATGTALLYTWLGAEPGWITMSTTTDDRALRWFFWNVGLIIAPLAEEARRSLVMLGELAETATTA